MSSRVFSGLAALVTGGAKRIGKAIALGLAQKGFDIALHYHRSENEAHETAEEINRLGVECRLFRADLSDPQAAENLVPEVFESFPGCSILIHNASLFERASFDQTDADLFNRLTAVNLRAPFLLSRGFARSCKQGHIIHLLDSETSVQSHPYFVYTWTKRSLRLLNEMLAKELSPNIRVNAVSPGLILPSGRFTESDFERMAQRVPLRKRGDPRDVVNAVLFLIENSNITGVCLDVDGGAHLVRDNLPRD
jgi:pteridine reductase